MEGQRGKRQMVRGIRKDKGRKQSERIMREKHGGSEGRGGKGKVQPWRNGGKSARSAASALLCSSLICHFICRGCGAKYVVFISHQKRTKWSLTYKG